MAGTERVVQLQLGETVVVKAVPFPVPEKAGQREDQKPAFEELEWYVSKHWGMIRNLRSGEFNDDVNLATEPDTFPLIEILKQFGVTPDQVRKETKKILEGQGLATREAGLHARAFGDFLRGFGE